MQGLIQVISNDTIINIIDYKGVDAYKKLISLLLQKQKGLYDTKINVCLIDKKLHATQKFNIKKDVYFYEIDFFFDNDEIDFLEMLSNYL